MSSETTNIDGGGSKSFQDLENQFALLQKAVNDGIKLNNNASKFDILSSVLPSFQNMTKVEIDSVTLKWLNLLSNCLTQGTGGGSQAYSSLIGSLISKLLDFPIGSKSQSTIMKNLMSQLQAKQISLQVKCTIVDSLSIVFKNNKTLSIIFLNDMVQWITKQIKALPVADSFPLKAACIRCLGNLIECSSFAANSVILDTFKFLKSVYPTAAPPNQLNLNITSVSMLLSPFTEFKIEIINTLVPIIKYYNQNDIKFENFDQKVLAFLSKLLEEENLKCKIKASETLGVLLSVLFYKDRESQQPSTPGILSPVIQGQMAAAQAGGQGNVQVKKTSWAMSDCLNFLGNLFYGNQKKEVKVNLSITYISFFQTLKLKETEKSIDLILGSVLKLLSVMPNNKSINMASAQDQVQSRACISMIIRQGLGEKLSETGQQAMLKYLANVLTQYESLNELIIVCALREISQLICELGEGGILNSEELSNQFILLLSDKNQSVRHWASICLRSLATNLPKFTSNFLTECLQNLNNLIAEIDKISIQPETQKRIMNSLKGYSMGCAALIASIKKTELGVPVLLLNQITKISSNLLTNPDLVNAPITLARMESGWIIMNSLIKFMGNHFVETIAQNLVMFWKSSFNITTVHLTSERDIAIFSRTRSDALVALHSFISYHPKLLNSKIIAQFVGFLGSTLKTVSELPAVSSQFANSTNELTHLLELNLIRAFLSLPCSSFAAHHTSLLTVVASLVLDGPANTMVSYLLTKDDEDALLPDFTSINHQFEQQFQIPISTQDSSIASCLHLPDCHSHKFTQLLELKVVNHAIELLSYLFVSQPDRHRVQLIDHLTKCVKEATNPQQKNTMVINSLTTILVILKSMSLNNNRFGKSEVTNMIQRFIQRYFGDSNPLIRRIASECIGLLCRVEGDSMTQAIISNLTEIVRKPVKEVPSSIRAGSAFVLGCIQRSIGGMMSQNYLPATLSNLHVLAQDQTSLDVSTYALHSLYVTIQTSGSFNDFAEPTLLLTRSLLVAENPPYQLIGRIINSIVVALGPELETVNNVLQKCLSTCSVIQTHPDPSIRVESIYVYQKLILFALNSIDDSQLVPFLISQLSSPHLSLRIAAVTCLRQLIQKKSSFDHAHTQLFETLFMMIDSERDQQLQKELKLLIFTLIDTIAPSNPSPWLTLCMSIILSSKNQEVAKLDSSATGLNTSSATNPTANKTSPPKDDENEEDDEEQSKQVVVEKSDGKVEYVHRWFTKVFALECIRKVISVVKNKPEHFSMPANHHAQLRNDLLVYQLHDLISISYKAAISQIDSMRPVGILLLKDILDGFSKSIDPDYEGHLLLELYQAQIMSALRPAFTPGALPTQLSIGCSVFVSFLQSSIHYDSVAIKKITLLLSASIKELRNLNFPNYNEKTTTLVQVAILKSFAQLYLLMLKNDSLMKILSSVINPLLSYLRVHWMVFLKEYSLLTLYTSQVYTLCKPTFFSPLTYQDSVEYFKDSYQPIMKALASLLNQKDYWLEGRKEGDDVRLELTALEKEFFNETTPTDDFNVILGLSLLSTEKYIEDSQDINFNQAQISFSLKILILLFKDQSNLSLLGDEKLEELLQILFKVINFNNPKIHLLILNLINEILNLNLIKNDQLLKIILKILFQPIDILDYSIENIEIDYYTNLYEIELNFLKLLVENETDLYNSYLPLILATVVQGVSLSNNQKLIASAIAIVNLVFRVSKSKIVNQESVFRSTMNTVLQQLNSMKETKQGLLLFLSILILNSSKDQLDEQTQNQIIHFLKTNISSNKINEKDKLLYLQIIKNILTSSSQLQDTENSHLYNFGSALIHSILVELLNLLKYPAELSTSGNKQIDIDINNEAIKIIVNLLIFSSNQTNSLSIIIQSLIFFLQPNNSSNQFHSAAIQILLNYASSNPNQFKESVSSIPQDLKFILEQSIRQTIESSQTKKEFKQPSKPQIQLNFDFSKNIKE